MKKFGLCFVLFVAACASPKPTVQTPVSNPYAGRPDLLSEQHVLVSLNKVRVEATRKCQALLGLATEDKTARAAILKVTAYNFCIERFQELGKKLDAATTKVHGPYLRVLILWQEVNDAFIEVARISAICEEAQGEKKLMCAKVQNTRELIAAVLAFVSTERYHALVPPPEEKDSKVQKDKDK